MGPYICKSFHWQLKSWHAWPEKISFVPSMPQFCHLSIHPPICSASIIHQMLPHTVSVSRPLIRDLSLSFLPAFSFSVSKAHRGFMSLKMHWVKQNLFLHVCSPLQERVLLRECEEAHKHVTRRTFEFAIVCVRDSNTESWGKYFSISLSEMAGIVRQIMHACFL